MTDSVVLSHYQARPLLEARRVGQTVVAVSPDLGLTTVQAALELEGVRLPGGRLLSWEALETIAASPQSCFVLEDSVPRKVQVYSQNTDCFYSLMPTVGAPTLLVSGIPMHRIKDTEPHQDTLRKVATIAPITGRVLDTATGLGYTAIQAALTAQEVVTVEVDPNVLEVARLNPWSRALFENPKIKQVIGDSFEVVREFKDFSFDRIIHDPPTFRIAGDLYSAEFYRQLYRVLSRRGRLFHYVADPESKTGHVVTAGVVRRLEEAGFSRVVRHPEAFGVVAYK